MTFLYIASENQRGPVKIGVAYDPDRLVKQMQFGNPRHLSVIHKIEMDETIARPLLREVRVFMHHLELREGWYDASENDAVAMVEACR